MKKLEKLKLLALIAIVFGALTIFSGGQALYGDEQSKAAVGNAVPYVLWFNFHAGFAYVLAGAGLWTHAKWAQPLAVGIAGGTALIGIAFLLHVLQGEAYELRTAAALLLRISFWTVTSVMVWRKLSERTSETIQRVS